MTSAGWLDGAAMAGPTQVLMRDEFASLYVLNMRGNATGHFRRTFGERKLANIFGQRQSASPSAIIRAQ